MNAQLPLQFEHRLNLTFNHFYPGPNQEIIDHLKNCVIGNGEQQIYLFGEHGLGKSHLLHACCRLAHERKNTTFYYAFDARELPSIEILSGLDEYELICFDDIEAIAGDLIWERNFFNFYNRHRDNGHRLILSSACPPAELAIELPDLKTRINWGLTLKLQELSDQQTVDALSFKAMQMGFEMPPNVGHFLISRYGKDPLTLWRILDELDQATLAAKRKLTLPLLKQILDRNQIDRQS